MGAVNNVNLNIVRVDTSGDVATRALEVFIEHANEAIDARGRFMVAISGGRTPEGFFRLLGESPKASAVPWDKVQLFWVDERCVAPDSDASNYGLAVNTFLNKTPIPESNVHRMFGESCDYKTAVEDYETTLRRAFDLKVGQVPQFDLIYLGMGADGHVGSLFPNSYVVFDTNGLVSPVYFMGEKCDRMTLTHPVLCAAKHLVILVSGSRKAEVVHQVLQGTPDEVKYPVHTLWPVLDRVMWIIDNEAAKYFDQ